MYIRIIGTGQTNKFGLTNYPIAEILFVMLVPRKQRESRYRQV
jgi:hypothetical protein